MGRLSARAFGTVVFSVAVSWVAPAALAASSAVAGKRPACVHAVAFSVHAPSGHNHVVAIDNACAAPVDCQVWTDVAPERLSTHLAPREKVELVTFRGSPSVDFAATVECPSAVR